MKKFLISMAIIWGAIGAGLFFAWWTVSKNLTPKEVNAQANKMAHELQIPWNLKIHKVQPRFAGDFRLVLKNIDAEALDGSHVLHANNAEIRMPWTMFFTRNPGQVNITVEGVRLNDWGQLLEQSEQWLEARKKDSTQQVSLPEHVVASRFNLRLNGIDGQYKGQERRVDKFYLLNLNPKNPSAFELVIPWSVTWKDAVIAGQTKALGEYRISQDKIDLHYYLKNRITLTHAATSRSGESSMEGKGFFHPKLGLFTTLSAKDDWLSLVGDVEWTKNHLKVDVPRFALSHELLLDLLPFDNLRSGSGPYQGAPLSGSLKWLRGKEERDFVLSLKSKSGLRISRPEGEGRLDIQADWKDSERATLRIALGEKTLFNLTHAPKASTLEWSSALFVPPSAEPEWLSPDAGIWDILTWVPWKSLQVTNEVRPTYRLERAEETIKVYGYIPWEAGPRLSLLYPPLSEKASEWVAEFSGQSIEKLFGLIGLESPVVTGFAFSGAMQAKRDGELGLKLAWKGPPIAMLSRSSCKVIMQDRPELSRFLNTNFGHQAEITYRAPNFEIQKWTLKGANAEWSVSGSWANQPIRCSLKLTEKARGKKPQVHDVVMN